MQRDTGGGREKMEGIEGRRKRLGVSSDGGGTLLALKGRKMASRAAKSHQGTALMIFSSEEPQRTLHPVPSGAGDSLSL